jgi:hypothetical protein
MLAPFSCSSPSRYRQVTLVCFGASADIEIRLRSLENAKNWADVLHDPYILIDILIDELYHLIMHHIKHLRNEFRQIENVRYIPLIWVISLTPCAVNHSSRVNSKGGFAER